MNKNLKGIILLGINKFTVSIVLMISALIIMPYAGASESLSGLFVSYYLFILSVIFVFLLPGFLINTLINAKNNLLENVFLSCVFGMLFTTLVFFTFSTLNLELLSLAVIGVIDYFALHRIRFRKLSFKNSDLLIFSSIVVMSSIFSLTMLTSGYAGEALRLIGVNNYDGLWYLALVNELKFNFPPQHPGHSGEMLTGYHFFLFFLMAKIGNMFNLSNINLMFKLFPVLVSLLWGFGVYALMLEWGKSKIISLFAVFLTMFGGSAVYVTWLYGHRNISLDSGYGILQPATSLVNPTFAISIVFLIAFLMSVYKYYESKSIRWFFVIALVAGLTPIFKVYGGIILMGGFVLFSLYELYKKNFHILLFIFGVGLIFYTTYLPFTDNSVVPVLYVLWAPHNVLRDNLPWYGYDEKIRTYTDQSVIKGIITTEFFALYVFIFGNLGTRLVGLFFGMLKAVKERKRPSYFAFLVWGMAGASFFIPLFFIQSGKVFETIQFTWYFLFLISLLSALGLGFFLSSRINKIVKTGIVSVIILLTLPSAIESLRGYILPVEGYMDQSLYDSYKYLAGRGKYDEVVLSLPKKNTEKNHDSLKRGYRAGRPLVPAIANKRSFLSYEYFPFDVNVDERIDLMYKILELEKIIDTAEPDKILFSQMEIEKRLKDFEVSYIHSPDYLISLELFGNIRMIYNNSGVFIYEVK